MLVIARMEQAMSDRSESVSTTLDRVVKQLAQGMTDSDEQLRLLLLGKSQTTDADGEEVARIFVLLWRSVDVLQQVAERWQRMENITVAGQVTIEPASSESRSTP